MYERDADHALEVLKIAMPHVEWRAEQLDIDCWVVRGKGFSCNFDVDQHREGVWSAGVDPTKIYALRGDVHGLDNPKSAVLVALRDLRNRLERMLVEINSTEQGIK
jgi:hypothetical protein